MGKTYSHSQNKYDDDRPFKRGKKTPNHASGKKSGGMRIINDPFLDEDEDYFDDDISITDSIVINKYRDEDSL